MITLHYYPSNASLIPHLLLEEFGVPFELALVDRANQAHKQPAYLELNPNGLIPVLVEPRAEGELVLYETAAICLYLLDAHSASGLAPAHGTVARAHFDKWLVWLTNTLQATLIIYFYPERWADDAAAVAQVKAHAEVKIGAMLDQLDAQLARHTWLLGDDFSAVDLYAFVLCRWTRGMARPARSLAHLGPWLQRLLARPAVQRAFSREGLTAPLV
jgi:glutathione S-transferase